MLHITRITVQVAEHELAQFKHESHPSNAQYSNINVVKRFAHCLRKPAIEVARVRYSSNMGSKS